MSLEIDLPISTTAMNYAELSSGFETVAQVEQEGGVGGLQMAQLIILILRKGV